MTVCVEKVPCEFIIYDKAENRIGTANIILMVESPLVSLPAKYRPTTVIYIPVNAVGGTETIYGNKQTDGV